MSTSDSASDSSGLTIRGTEDPRSMTSALVENIWRDYFQDKLTIPARDQLGQFNAYFSSPQSPSDAVFVFHHGAGSSGMSYAALASQLHSLCPHYGLIAFDARLHGESVQSRESLNADFTLETLCRDFTDTVRTILSQKFEAEHQPDLVLVGHSMGGAVVAHSAKVLKRVIGLVLIDVVEGSAIDALRTMQTFLNTRPKSFPTIDAAVSWHISTGTIRNAAVAALSVPPLLRQQSGDDPSWIWKTDLLATQPYWSHWFTGLSKTFLAAPCSKLLILAGTDRLDKQLMIAHMQGTYQLSVLPEAGHFVHEDEPQRVAALLHDFVVRFQSAHDVIRLARMRFRDGK